jgi:DNA-binding transcriptional LysR family regulator
VRRLLADHAGLCDLGCADATGIMGVLRITAPAYFGRLHVMPLVANFLVRHPQLRADLLLIDRVVSLVEEGIDIGCASAPCQTLHLAPSAPEPFAWLCQTNGLVGIEG